jgi:hypothetical protein
VSCCTLSSLGTTRHSPNGHSTRLSLNNLALPTGFVPWSSARVSYVPQDSTSGPFCILNLLSCYVDNERYAQIDGRYGRKPEMWLLAVRARCGIRVAASFCVIWHDEMGL